MTPDCSIFARSPVDLLAVTPYVLGFHPADSVVAVGMAGAEVAFAARFDLPPPGTDVSEVAAMVAAQGVPVVSLIGYGPPALVTPAVLGLGRLLGRLGVLVFEVIRVTDGRWWSYLCGKPQCCPAEGSPCPPPGSAPAAEAVLSGNVALPDRQALVAQVAAVTGAARAAMTAATGRARARLTALYGEDVLTVAGGRSIRRAGRLAVREAERRYRAGRPLTDDEVAWLCVLLVDSVVLDYALDRSAGEHWRIGLWTEVTRRAESDGVAGPASLLSYAAWHAGNGALARVAVDRALMEEPGHRLAGILDGVLAAGLGPEAVAALQPPPVLPQGAGLGSLIRPAGRHPVRDTAPRPRPATTAEVSSPRGTSSARRARRNARRRSS